MSRSTSFSHIERLRRAIGRVLALLLICGTSSAQAGPLTAISELTVSERGDATVIQLRAAAKPMFSVFKLEKPARLTVDVANGEFRGVPGLLDVDSWAVSQVATAGFQTSAARIARLMINFRRPAHYTVTTQGGVLSITILPEQPRPKTDPVRLSRELQNAKHEVSQAQQAAQAARSQAEKDRHQAAAQKLIAEQRQKESATAKARLELERKQTAAQRQLAAQQQKQEQAVTTAELESERKQATAARAQAAAARAEAERLKGEAEAQKLVAAGKARELQYALQALEQHERELQTARGAAARHKLALGEAQHGLAQREALVRKLRDDMQRAQQATTYHATGRQADAAAAQLRVKQIETRLAGALAQLQQAQSVRTHNESQLRDAEQRRQRAEAAWGDARQAQQTAEQARAHADQARHSAEARQLATEEKLRQEESRRRQADQALKESRAKAALLDSARDEVLTRRAKLEELAGKVRSLEQQLENARTREEQQRQELLGAQRQAETSRRAASEAQTAHRALADVVSAEKTRSGLLLREIDRVKSEVEQQKALAAAAVAQVARLTRGVENARVRLERQTEENGRKLARAELSRAEQHLRQAEASRLAAERSRAALETDIRRREQQQQDVARALDNTERRLQQAKARATGAERQLAETERRLGEGQRTLQSMVTQRQREEARKQDVEQARRSEEKLFGQAEGRRRQAEQARALAEKRLAGVQTALAQTRKARLVEEKALTELRRQQEQASREVREALLQRERARRGLGRGARAARQVAAQWAAKEKAATRAKLPPAVVKDIRYVDGDKTAQIQVVLDGRPAHRLTHEGSSPLLSLEGIVMPKLLQRTLDVTEFSGPVSQVTSFVPDPSSGAAVIRVSLREPGAKSRLRQDGDRLIWEFNKSVLAKASPAVAGPGAAKPDDTASFNAPRVAGVRVKRGGEERRYSGRRIDLDFKDADIHNILRLLADVGNVNIVTADNVGGRVTIRMRDVPWDQALDVILRAKGLGQVREGNLLRVAPAVDLEKERESEIARQKQVALLKPLETRLIPLSYASASDMLEKVRYSLSPRGALTFDNRTNMVIARDIAGNLDLMERMIRNLDTQTPQVLIEARVIEARTNYSKEIGIQWGGFFSGTPATGTSTGLVFPNTVGIGGGATDGNAPLAGLIPTPTAPSPAFAVNMPASTGTGRGGALGLSLGSVSGNAAISLRLSAAEASGDIRIVSAPKITTLDNVEAMIEQGVTIPFSQVSAAGVQTTFQDAKLSLTVKPHVTADGSIIMNVSVTRNEPDFANVGANGLPTILKKQAKTEMLVKDGDTAVIGGIYTTRTGRSYAKVPWFADIPVIGYLFKHRAETSDREEVLVFITPRIINRAQSIGR